ncbi:FecR domain-containing protein [Carboxylicivirga mesophila]|uniref:FecR domain-containing protein n=1 Tax=Carboxylicivirga mesophila TaxID=1166478 RepID=A0ABS5KDV1_9BACT|nr:FecR domain-containing protein [Carboxylicivirga mesophila]MBS2212701.1 FecR domain-containing protein [Carboxylicivirga mesophila]
MDKLIVKYLNGTASNAELIELLDYIRASDGNKKYFEQQKELWKSNTKKVFHFRTEADWQAVKNKLTKKSQPKSKLKVVLLSIASVVVAFLCIAAIMLYQAAIEQDVLVQTKLGQRFEVVLPDSSKVIMNENSSLSYNALQFIFKREVYLNGEAFFDVQHSGLKFNVNSGPLNVEVLGTRFNINHDMAANKVDVYLESGSVMLTVDNNSSCQKILKPGQQATYQLSTKDIDVSEINSLEQIVWSKDDLIIRDETLENFFKQLGKRYGVKFDLDDESALKDLKISLTIKDDPLNKVLEIIQLSVPIRIANKSNCYEVKLDNVRYKK